MKYFSTLNCSEHKSIYECPDVLVAINGSDHGFIIHDGGSSKITIEYCPWCGTALGAQ
ncbi:DUF6980 family protein [Microbulbifer sp. TRSA002]|uniref:DUF6980 family protein n=1 Tax=Microbulbifer sp. TRSA002 TaxID=3243382 RepID=UPI004039222A